jgi:hypothetical protein
MRSETVSRVRLFPPSRSNVRNRRTDWTPRPGCASGFAAWLLRRATSPRTPPWLKQFQLGPDTFNFGGLHRRSQAYGWGLRPRENPQPSLSLDIPALDHRRGRWDGGHSIYPSVAGAFVTALSALLILTAANSQSGAGSDFSECTALLSGKFMAHITHGGGSVAAF